MRTIPALLCASLLALPSAASAWGYEGHRVVADIARSYLTPASRVKIDAILVTDTDDLTGHDMESEATWADVFRSAGHRETAQWHFVDQEIDGSADLGAACFGFPAAVGIASAGPPRDCVVDKITEFAAELAAPATSPTERLLALKFLLHFVGDVHQPLHASDNRDRGGNCVLVALGGSRTVNLHSYWDTGVLEKLGPNPVSVATTLRARITPSDVAHWSRGDAAEWAREAFEVARTSAYVIGSPAGCRSDVAPITLDTAYTASAEAAAARQLERAGVRLAMLLNSALATAPAAGTAQPKTASTQVASDAGGPTSPSREQHGATGPTGRTPESLACSADADARGLHGKERQNFRRKCMRERSGS